MRERDPKGKKKWIDDAEMVGKEKGSFICFSSFRVGRDKTRRDNTKQDKTRQNKARQGVRGVRLLRVQDDTTTAIQQQSLESRRVRKMIRQDKTRQG